MLVEVDVHVGGEMDTIYGINGELRNNYLANAKHVPTGYDARVFENIHSHNNMILQQLV